MGKRGEWAQEHLDKLKDNPEFIIEKLKLRNDELQKQVDAVADLVAAVEKLVGDTSAFTLLARRAGMATLQTSIQETQQALLRLKCGE